MLVREILEKKGNDVFTAHPEDRAGDVLDSLLERGIGSAIVVDRRGRVVGVFSERDLLHGIGRRGAIALDLSASELMTTRVPVCGPDDKVTDVMALMTHRRMRHVPVIDGDRLRGVVSIGDVVKHRLDEIQLEVNVLRDYARVAVR